MRKIKMISRILLLIGFVLFFCGWMFQVFSFGVSSDSYNEVYTLSLIRKYTFLILGGLMLLISYITKIIGEEMEKL